MLKNLTIRNYALIDSLEISFGEGLSTVTGETGAGKSIMIGALSLLLGGRADSKVVRDKSRKSIIEAVFTVDDSQTAKYEAYGLDIPEGETIIRREISQSGKSRAFIDDTPVNLTTLTAITSGFIDIHSQHANLSLRDPSLRLEMIDAYGNNQHILKEYNEIFNGYATLHKQIRRLSTERQRLIEDEQFIRFRLDSISKVNPQKGELRHLEEEYDLLSESTDIRQKLTESAMMMTSDDGVLSNMGQIRSLLGTLPPQLFKDEDPGELPLTVRLDSLIAELSDISETVSDKLDTINADPGRQSFIEQRINAIYDLMNRFKVKDEAELIEMYDMLKSQLAELSSPDGDLSEMNAELKAQSLLLKEKGAELSAAREKAAADFATDITEVARELGLPNLRCIFSVVKGKLGANGADSVEFLASFNKKQELRSVAEVASGGEMSRLMLAIKNIMAGKMNLPTIIFDEIDTGVSGETADKIGRKMKDMSRNVQVIAITHLPQVAAIGNKQYKVYKQDVSDTTLTSVRELREDERVEEIARMLSGAEINEAAKLNARSLLGDTI